MVEFDAPAALLGGLVATVVMSAMMAMAVSAGLSQMPTMPLVTGSMASGDRSTAIRMGAVMHYLVMGTVVFGITYGMLFAAFDEDAWWLGAVLGLAQGILVGLVFMPLMPMMHPRMSRSSAAGAGTVRAKTGGEVQLTAPGVFGKDWGAMTPLGMLGGHMVYGVVLALVYGWVA